jgi:hypothetical protein
VRLIPGESCIVAVLLGVVELWLSQDRPQKARTGVWSYAAALICLLQPGVRREHAPEPVAVVTAPPNKTSASAC